MPDQAPQSLKEIQEYQQRARAAGRCVQCINPWFDGMCECRPKPSPEQLAETDRVHHAVFDLGLYNTIAGVRPRRHRR